MNRLFSRLLTVVLIPTLLMDGACAYAGDFVTSDSIHTIFKANAVTLQALSLPVGSIPTRRGPDTFCETVRLTEPVIPKEGFFNRAKIVVRAGLESFVEGIKDSTGDDGNAQQLALARKLGFALVDWNGIQRLQYADNFEPFPLDADVELIRHGETISIAQGRGILQGNIDEPDNQLSSAGEAEAEHAADLEYAKLKDLLTNYKVSPLQRLLFRMRWYRRRNASLIILISPLTRAQATARPLIEKIQTLHPDFPLHVETVRDAREIAFGSLDGKNENDIREQLEPAAAEAKLARMRRYRAGDPAVIGEGRETFLDMLWRGRKLLHFINQHFRGRKVLIFTHGTLGNGLRLLEGDPALTDAEGLINWRTLMLPTATPFVLRPANIATNHTEQSHASQPHSIVLHDAA